MLLVVGNIENGNVPIRGNDNAIGSYVNTSSCRLYTRYSQDGIDYDLSNRPLSYISLGY